MTRTTTMERIYMNEIYKKYIEIQYADQGNVAAATSTGGITGKQELS